jgi:hypothetical protein
VQEMWCALADKKWVKNLVGNKNLNHRLNLYKSRKYQLVDRIRCSDDKV